jgi:perosamine synthetase
MKIPPVKLNFDENEREEVKSNVDSILSSGFLTLGKFCKQFEANFSSYVGTKHGVATNSGTSALEIILRSFGLNNSEVIVPTNTFFATPAAVLHSGNKVKFADCDKSLCVGVDSIKKSITGSTKAVIVVHIGGIVTPEIMQIKELCEQQGLLLIEDAAHAHGSTLNGKHAGSFGDAAAFSFFATKVMTSAEGGMVVTNNKEVYDNSLILRDQGKSGLGNIHTLLGYNWRMGEINAAIGLSQLERLNGLIEGREKIAEIYFDGLKDIDGINPLVVDKGNKSNYYKYTCFIDDVDRGKLKVTMKEKYGISLAGEVYEKPCHLQPVFKDIGYKLGDFPVAEKLCQGHICLPIYPSMGIEEAQYVVDSLRAELK